MTARTLYEKLWSRHAVCQRDDGATLLYIDRHLVHEVTSPQAFEGLRLAGRKLWRRQSVLAVIDHNVSTSPARADGGGDETSLQQMAALRENCGAHNLPLLDIDDERQGIVHVIGPEQGETLPGLTVVCGDSHTSTHGAFGCLAFGIGTSEIEHVLATQCIAARRAKTMRININGRARAGVHAKDLILAVIGKIGAGGATGFAVEYAGGAVAALSMSGRMTVCNMSIEAGAAAGMVAVDDKTLDFVRGKPQSPRGEEWERAEKYWRDLKSDEGASFDREENLNAADIAPQVSWGTSPEMVSPIGGRAPDPEKEKDPVKREGIKRALDYMGLPPGAAIADIRPDHIFIGSCTNGRIEDLRAAAEILRAHPGKKIAGGIKRAMVVPGSGLVKKQAEEEGLDELFTAAGFEWRAPGCSMCLGMNEDKMSAGDRCASTSNRNFEGRQGYKSRTHLASPATTAAAALYGRFVDVSQMM